VKELQAYRFWGFATTFGALWGAAEITAGSFLHAMKVPFAGVALSGVGVALLLTLRALLPSRGVVLAAGLVCAGVKMLSPAGAVVGPMIAILGECLVVEAVVAPIGPRPAAGALAGGLCSVWAIAQRLITQCLLLGMPVLGIYKGILGQAERWLHLPCSGGAWAAAIFLGVVALIGVGFGVAGAMIGSAAAGQLREAAR
jgi:hypothetical protein